MLGLRNGELRRITNSENDVPLPGSLLLVQKLVSVSSVDVCLDEYFLLLQLLFLQLFIHVLHERSVIGERFRLIFPEIITDFIDFCSDKDIPVLFVKYPSVMRYEKDFEANERMNSVLELAESKGCATLDLEKRFSEIGLDEASDYYNRSHPNVRGQKKITEYLGSYIQNEMGIGPSELDASLSEDWDRASAYYEVFCDIAEEMIADGKSSLLSDSPGMLETISERANDR